VRKNNGMILVLVISLAGLLAGCSDAKDRQDSKALLKAVDEAQRLYTKALAMMATPAIGQQEAEEFKEMPSKRQTLNSQAWTTLQQAERTLTTALREQAEAKPPEKSLANAMLGRILMLKGDYQATIVSQGMEEAQRRMGLLGGAATRVQIYINIERCYKQLTSMSNEEVAEMLVAARRSAAELQGDIDKLSAKLADLNRQGELLHAANEKLIPQARDLRVDSQLRSGKEGLELMDKAIKIEEEINANASKIAQLENAAELEDVKAQDKRIALEIVQGREKAAQSILDSRKAFTEKVNKDYQDAQETLAKAKQSAESYVMQLAETCQKLSDSEKIAAECYESAAGRFRTSQQGDITGRGAAGVAQSGDAYWSLATLQARSLQLRSRINALMGRLASAWTGQQQTAATAPSTQPENVVPDFAKVLLAYLPNADEVRKSAEKNYEEAADAYSRAEGMVNSNLRWAYQGQAAAAYIGHYRLSGNPEIAEKARAALKEALEGKRESRYLASVVELEKMLQAKGKK
jgi:fructose-specific component phosphotransferase system IIB-like protein